MVPGSVLLAVHVEVGGPLETLVRRLHVILQLTGLLVLLPGVDVRLGLLRRLQRKDVQTTGVGHLRINWVHPLGGASHADHSALLPVGLQRRPREAGAPGQVGQGAQHQEARSSAAAHLLGSERQVGVKK